MRENALILALHMQFDSCIILQYIACRLYFDFHTFLLITFGSSLYLTLNANVVVDVA